MRTPPCRLATCSAPCRRTRAPPRPPRATTVVTGEITPNLAAAVTAWCASHDVIPDRMTTGARTLEDVFLTLTGKELRS